MTRIAGVPEQLAALSKLLTEGGVELSVAAVSVSNVTLPEMPPGVAAQVAASLHDVTDALRRAAMTAETDSVDLRKRALWFAVADGGGATALYAAFAFKAIGDIPLDGLDTASRVRVAAMLKAWGRYDRVVAPVVDEYGADSLAATKIWLLWECRNPMPLSRLKTVVEGAGDAGVYAEETGVPLTALRAVATKVLGPVNIAASAFQVIDPEHRRGWMRTADRVAGVANITGSIGTLGMEFLPAAAAIPGLDVAVGALLIGAAGYEIYANRKALARVVVAGTKAAGTFAWQHRAYIMAGPAGAPAVFVWNHRGEAAKLTVSATTWGVDHAEEGARVVLHGVEDAPGAVVSGISSGWKAVTSWP